MNPAQPPSPPSKPKLIHIAKITQKGKGSTYLFLRQTAPYHYVWFHEIEPGLEAESEIFGGTAQEALIAAYQRWKFEQIRTVNCGFRYTLPERDEVGANALFHQMAASYLSASGIYFDEELSSNCVVQLASSEARSLLKRLQ